MAAMLVDTLIRFQRTGYKPKRAVKIALTAARRPTARSTASNGWRRTGAT
jgi:hypothetical protein